MPSERQSACHHYLKALLLPARVLAALVEQKVRLGGGDLGWPHQGDVRVVDMIPLPRQVAYEGRVVAVAQRLAVVDYDRTQVVQAVGAPAALARREMARRESARARGRVRVGGRRARYSARFALGTAGGARGSRRCIGRCFGGSVELSKGEAFEWEGDAPARLARALVKREAFEMDAEEGRRVEDAKDLWGRGGAVVSTCMHEGCGGGRRREAKDLGRFSQRLALLASVRVIACDRLLSEELAQSVMQCEAALSTSISTSSAAAHVGGGGGGGGGSGGVAVDTAAARAAGREAQGGGKAKR